MNTQLTLGRLVDILDDLPPLVEIYGLGRIGPHSRCWPDIAFRPSDSVETAGDLLERCRAALGTSLANRKGGTLIDENSRLWVAEYRRAGERLMGLTMPGCNALPPRFVPMTSF